MNPEQPKTETPLCDEIASRPFGNVKAMHDLAKRLEHDLTAANSELERLRAEVAELKAQLKEANEHR